MKEHVIVWFRQDLRIADNPALAAAAATGLPILAVYIHAPEEEGRWAPGGASNWWLHHALVSLGAALKEAGLPLLIRRGASLETLEALIGSYRARAVFWNRRYEPATVERDQCVGQALRAQGIETHSSNSALLYEPHEIANRSGQPFRVFTPFWKHLYSLPVRTPVRVDRSAFRAPQAPVEPDDPEKLGLLPDISWDEGFYRAWKPSLAGASSALAEFVQDKAGAYKNRRDQPGVDGTSRLSPYLHFGQLGPRQVWHALLEAGTADGPGGHTFLSEIGWREFAYHLLTHFPHTPEEALNEAYRNFPWQPDSRCQSAWERGMTGYPVVDAGMRQLWQTGWMHNRVRMIAASFLVKHLLQPWQAGARWFWDTLVDADLASNTMGWQWTAGCGADAAPYFRIFNPILQGEKFDPDGTYVRRFVPELARLPDRYLHQPWEAPPGVRASAGVKLGVNYPEPVIDHALGRQRALAALQANKSGRA